MAVLPPPKQAEFWDWVPGMVLLVRADGTRVAANSAFQALFGCSATGVVGNDWAQILPEGSWLALLAALGKRRDFRIQVEARRADGLGWIEWTGRWVEQEARFVCLLHESPRRASQSARRRRRPGMFRLLADNVPVLIAYYRASDLKCQFANKAYARTLRP